MPEDWKDAILGDYFNISTGKLDANAQVFDGEYPFFTCAEKPLKINSFAFDTEAILVSGNGAYVGYMNYYSGRFNAYQRTYVLSEFKIPVVFVWWFLKQNLKERIALSLRGSSTPYIVLGTIKDFPFLMPDTETMERFHKLTAP